MGECPHLTHFQQAGGIADVGHDSQRAEIGNGLSRKFEALACKIGPLCREARDVPPAAPNW